MKGRVKSGIELRISCSNIMLNYRLSQKLKLLGNDEFNHLTISLTRCIIQRRPEFSGVVCTLAHLIIILEAWILQNNFCTYIRYIYGRRCIKFLSINDKIIIIILDMLGFGMNTFDLGDKSGFSLENKGLNVKM